MANDINKAIVANPIKNGTTIVSCKVTGPSAKDLLNSYVKNTPTISDIEAKYDDRFYNGIFVQLTGDTTIVGA